MAFLWQRLWIASLFVSVRWFLGGILRRFWFWLPPLLLDGADAIGLYNKVKPWVPVFVSGWVDWLIEHALVGFGLLVGWAAVLTYHELRRQLPTGRALLRPRIWEETRQGNVLLHTVLGGVSVYGMGVTPRLLAALENWTLRVYVLLLHHFPEYVANFLPLMLRPQAATPTRASEETAPGLSQSLIREFLGPLGSPDALEIERFLRARLAILGSILQDLDAQSRGYGLVSRA